MKLVSVLILLILLPPLISESFSYFDGDMISHNIEDKNYNFNESTSQIIQFNEPSNEQQVKRYLIFGKGYINVLGGNGSEGINACFFFASLVFVAYFFVSGCKWDVYLSADWMCLP